MIKSLFYLSLSLLSGLVYGMEIMAMDKIQINSNSSGKEEIVLGHVSTNARMATPCGKGRRNPKAELNEIEAEIKKLGPSSQSI